MKISAIAMLRNEEYILQETLSHVKTLVDDIYVYDDCSTDNTVRICKDNGVNVIKGDKWGDSVEERTNANGINRNKAYLEAMKGKPDYIYCFDADEIADFTGIDFTHDYYKLRLFDFYTTKGDNAKWNEHKWMGPEYRDIIMLFKPNSYTQFMHREPARFGNNGKNAGYVKHFSKCISEKRWDEDCDYYIKYFPEWASKWKSRKGKYTHEYSDFGRGLIKWKDRDNEKLIVHI